jgi:hypothetical protein
MWSYLKKTKLLQATLLLATVLFLPDISQAWVGTYRPRAAIEYDSTIATAVHGSPLTFSQTTPTILEDVVQRQTNKWFASSVTSIATINGFAHSGQTGEAVGVANLKCDALQVWGWHDRNGDGKANIQDSRFRDGGTTKWILKYEIDPDSDDAGIADGNVIGWEVAAGANSTSDYHSNLLQNGSTITVASGEAWIFIIRVVDTSGFTNLYDIDGGGGTEQWDDGDTGNGIGSDIPGDKYVDSNGNTPETSDARIEDDEVVFIYVRRSQ